MAKTALAIDAMGGDYGPRVVVPATLKYLQETPAVSVFLVGNQSEISPLISTRFASRVTIVHADEVIAMDEKVSVALRTKKNSSLRLALELVANSEAQACVSAGNTGALMALGRYLLKTIDGVSRPAICGAVPSLNSHSYLLDMGANVDCAAQDLLCFAIMASVLVKELDGKPNPTVALLNNGEEAIKGNNQVKEAAELLAQCKAINYIGFVEGDKLYEAAADIIVCDGFVGNIALKASEGVAKYVIEKIRQEIKSDPISRFLSLFALPEFHRIKSKIDPRRFNGASLLGLKGIVVKSHGNADELAFFHALQHASYMMSADIVHQLDIKFKSLRV
jgi:glycerol-3-phosphate acyltransferase PlsX